MSDQRRSVLIACVLLAPAAAAVAFWVAGNLPAAVVCALVFAVAAPMAEAL